jgi:NAD(P)-dependent dehydrogenase (short-subunit alcohol dehydrogenase family)
MSKIDYDGRVIVVTGAGRGMGAAHATELARRGARVVVNDYGGDMRGGGHSAAPAEDVVQRIEADGGTAVVNDDTVATPDGARGIIKMAIDTYGRLDGVLHNAGIASFSPLAEMSDELYDQMLAVHLHGGFYLTRAAWPHLAEQGGSLLYISSGAGLYGVPEVGHYAAAKLGLIGLSRVAATEGAAVGIRANALAVAASTRMMDDVMAEAPNMLHWFQTYMKPELPAAASCWLLHPDCTVTGRIYEAFGARMAEICITETEGWAKLDATAEEYRDHFEEIQDRSSFIVPDGPDDFHGRMFGYIVGAGAEPPQPDVHAATQIAVAEAAGSSH